jgi:hypothetical protein
MSVDPSVSADSQVRRRIVSAPRRTVSPVAVITRDPAGVAALVEKLKLTRPVVTFPSLAHFCTERQRAERWAGIVIGQACAWDARLDQYVVDRDCIALYGEEEGYGWPEAVYRLATGDLDTWAQQLDAPRPERPPVVRTREKRAPREGGEPRTKRSRSVFTLWSPDRVVSVDGSTGEQAASAPSAAASPGGGVVVKRTVFREPLKKRTPEQQNLPFATDSARQGKPGKKAKVGAPTKSTPSKSRAEQAREKAEAKQAAMREAACREAATFAQRAPSAREKAARSRTEDNLMRLAAEIGFVNAQKLLHQLRNRALEAVR